MKELSIEEMKSVKAGAALTLTAVMSVLVIAIVAVVAYRLFMSSEGSTTIPGGFKFTWE